MHRSNARRHRWLPVAAGGLAAAMAAGSVFLAIQASALAAPGATAAVAAAGPDGVAAGNAALTSVDLAGRWSFTPAGRGATSITVPGGGWYKQGFTDVNEAVYSRSITVPDSGQPQSTWIEFGAVNHQATLSVDGRVVATQTTAFTPSNFDISAYAAPGSTHTISVDVKGRGAFKSNNRYAVPDAAEWSEAVPQGIFRSAFLRVYPAVYVSDTFVRTSVANKTLSYDVSVRNTSGSSRSVTLTGSLSSINGSAFSYPALPSRTVTVAAHSTATVTVGPVAWTLDSTSYWWPNVPYRSGYRAQLHGLTVRATTDDGHTSDAAYRFGFREATQNGEYYYLNGVRVNFRGDNLQGADYDRINNGGKGDAYDTLPGFLPPSSNNGGWPQAVDNYQRLNYNVIRIHQEPGSPYMLDVADEMGLMLIDEVAIRGSQSQQEWKTTVGHDNMVNHARALVLRDRNHPAVIRWSQNNEPNQSGQDSEQFEKELYTAMNGADGTRPVSVEVGVGNNVSLYPSMTYANFAVLPHYVDGFGRYGEGLVRVNGRPDGEGESIWPASNNKQGFEWFATATLAKRGKDASDLRPYALLSAWASVVPGVRSTDFTPEEGGHPIYGADNLPDPWSNPQIQRVQAAFHPVAAVDLPYWSASGNSDSNGTFPLPQAVPSYARNTSVTRNVTVFNDDFADTSVGLTWTARLDNPTGTVVGSGSTSVNVPLGSRVTQPVTFTTPGPGSRVYLQLSTTKSGHTVFSDAVEYFNLSGPPQSPSPSPSSSPSPSPSVSVSPSSSAPPAGACSATYRTVGTWSGGFQGEVTVTAGGTAINGWTAKWTLDSGQSISQIWSGTLTTSGSTVSVSNVAYNGALAASASTTFGFLGTGNASAPTITCTSP